MSSRPQRITTKPDILTYERNSISRAKPKPKPKPKSKPKSKAKTIKLIKITKKMMKDDPEHIRDILCLNMNTVMGNFTTTSASKNIWTNATSHWNKYFKDSLNAIKEECLDNLKNIALIDYSNMITSKFHEINSNRNTAWTGYPPNAMRIKLNIFIDNTVPEIFPGYNGETLRNIKLLFELYNYYYYNPHSINREAKDRIIELYFKLPEDLQNLYKCIINFINIVPVSAYMQTANRSVNSSALPIEYPYDINYGHGKQKKNKKTKKKPKKLKNLKKQTKS